MSRELLKDLNISELMAMRESGMSNHEIADALDVTYKTVLAAIGRQPKELRRKPEYRSATLQPPTYAHEPKPDDYDTCLIVANRLIELEGVFGSYNIPIRQKVINIASKDHGGMQVPFDKLDDFIHELQAIQRRMSNLSVSTEMW